LEELVASIKARAENEELDEESLRVLKKIVDGKL
jgi:ribosomal protein L22